MSYFVNNTNFTVDLPYPCVSAARNVNQAVYPTVCCGTIKCQFQLTVELIFIIIMVINPIYASPLGSMRVVDFTSSNGCEPLPTCRFHAVCLHSQLEVKSQVHRDSLTHYGYHRSIFIIIYVYYSVFSSPQGHTMNVSFMRFRS